MQEHGLQSGTTGLIWVVIGMMVWVLAADARGQSVGSHELQSLPAASGKGGLTAQRQSAEQRQMLLNASLIYAVKNGQILQADDFLKRGAEPDAADGDGMTALMHAALLGNRELLDLMITHHADVNAMDNNGMTALMQAAWAGHEEVVDDLLVAGAMLDLKTSPHTTRITKSGANALIAAAIGGNLEVVRYLLGQGAKVNECDADGETALLQAARGGNPRLVELLLRNGADSEGRDKYGRTPLMVAAIHNHQEAVRALLAHGANRKAKDKAGLTAGRYARAMGYEAIHLLLTP